MTDTILFLALLVAGWFMWNNEDNPTVQAIAVAAIFAIVMLLSNRLPIAVVGGTP